MGWDDAPDTIRAAGSEAARPAGRVFIEFNYIFRVYVHGGEIDATLAGRLKHHARSRSELPAVGDWVVVRRPSDEERGAIVAVLPRRSRFSRRMAGNVTDEQVVAANVNVTFIVMGLDHDYARVASSAIAAGARERRGARGAAHET